MGDVDHVNLFNGNLVATIPVGTTYPVGDGFSYHLSLVYNSNVWDHKLGSLTRADPSPDWNAGLGWQMALGRLFPPGSERNESVDEWVFLSQDGAEHVFYPTLHHGEAAVSGVMYTRDGSYLRLQIGPGTALVERGDGVRFSFSNGGACLTCTVGEWRLDKVEDLHSNNLSIFHEGTSTAPVWRMVDSRGRTQRVYFTRPLAGAGYVVDKVDLIAFGGATATWDLDYRVSTVERPVTDDDPTTPLSLQVVYLVGVYAPDGSHWSMLIGDGSYARTKAESTARGPGVLKKLRLPTLGRIEWDWGIYHFPREECEPAGERGAAYRNTSSGVMARRVVGLTGAVQATWSYAQVLENRTFACSAIRQSTTTVTAPDGSRTESFFFVDHADPVSYALPYTPRTTNAADGVTKFLSRQIYEAGAASPTRESYVRYAKDDGLVWIGKDNTRRNRRVDAELTLYKDDPISAGVFAYASATYESFDGLGHYRLRKNGGNFPYTGGGNARWSHTNFNPQSGSYPGAFSVPAKSSPWLLGLYDYQWEKQGSVYAKREACFDAATGRLTRTRALRVGLSRDAHDVVVNYIRGPIANGHQITERWYGGDPQALDTASELCTMPLPTRRRRRSSTRRSSALFRRAASAVRRSTYSGR